MYPWLCRADSYSATLFNEMMLRREFCSFRKAADLRMHLRLLDGWFLYAMSLHGCCTVWHTHMYRK